MSARVISFSVWGTDPRYYCGILANLQLAPTIYPGWSVRVYHDQTVSAASIAAIRSHGGTPICVDQNQHQCFTQNGNGWAGLFWRFLPAIESDLDAFIVRDADSRLNWRERSAVDEWLASGRPLHVMRDHYEHSVAIMGGMWGHRGAIDEFNESLQRFVLAGHPVDVKGSDQEFLASEIWPALRNQCIVHDRYHEGLLLLPNGGQLEMLALTEITGTDKDTGALSLKDGRVIETTDFYRYEPREAFGDHDVRRFPPHLAIDGAHVGEIVDADHIPN